MEQPKRKEIRLKEYDYSENGAYFVTICTKDKRHFLSTIRVGDGLPDVPLRFAMSGIADDDCVQMAAVMEGGQAKTDLPDVPYAELTAYGQIVKHQFETMNGLYENIKVNHYVIMPNHIHFLIEIKNGRSRTPSLCVQMPLFQNMYLHLNDLQIKIVELNYGSVPITTI